MLLKPTCVVGALLNLAYCQSTISQGSDSKNHGHKGYVFGEPGVNATFDYVVIGGGTAGLTIATRLAENSSIKVAVVEAGGFYETDNGNRSIVPAYDAFSSGFGPLGINALVDWKFNTTPQAGADNRVLHYARGKTLGGSSARNFLWYHRPTIGALQKWADEVGDQSFTFSNMLQYFKKSVNFTPPQIQYKNSTNQQDPTAFSPSGGPLQVSFGRDEDPFGTWMQKGLRAIGQKLIKGFSSGVLIGTSYMAFSEDPVHSHRSSSESSFLESTKKINTQLAVYNNTLAERIIFNGPARSAQGVLVAPEGESKPNGKPYALFAKKEVILAAGAFQSPQLLMVSGVGPRETLEQHGIKVLKDLPGVGQNMWDHVSFGTSFRVDVSTLSAGLNTPAVAAEEVEEYNQTPAIGPLTIPSNPYVGWENLPLSYFQNLSKSTQEALADIPSDWPVLEWIPIDLVFMNQSSLPGGGPVDGYNYATVSTALVAPFSRGNLTIKSAQMSDAPVINPNWMTDPSDIDVAVAGFKRQRELWTKLSPITIGKEYFPGPQVESDADILHYIREILIPIWHASATCKMGKLDDKMAVVDANFRVFGTAKLRIVDASAFPFLPPGHPQAVVYAIAEKLAAQILAGR